MSEHGSKASTADTAHAGETRRDFIHIAAATVAGARMKRMPVSFHEVMNIKTSAPTDVTSERTAIEKVEPKKVSISVAIWLPYLLLSKRVNLTYRGRVAVAG